MVQQDVGIPGQQAKTPEEWFESHSRNVKNARISHALITPGATIEQALAKATLASGEELNALLFLLAELELNGCTIYAAPPLNTIPVMVFRRLIGSSSVMGKARHEAAEADIGIIDQAAHQTYLTGKPASLELKSRKGIFKKKDNEERTGNGD